MEEEIGSKNANIIAESAHWYSYDIPLNLINKLWDGKYRGQSQKWFLIKFHGEDQDINLNFHEPEFSDWKWVTSNQLIAIIMPFKRKLYKLIIDEFSNFIMDKN
jgi:putative (di)nucleoside polyphosphate hydrolase